VEKEKSKMNHSINITHKHVQTARRIGQEYIGLSLRNRRTWYTDQPPTDPPAQQQPPPPPATPPADQGGKGDKGKPVELTSQQLKDRLERARAAAQAELLKELGFDDAAKLKTALQTGSDAAAKLQTVEQQQAVILAKFEAMEKQQQAVETERRTRLVDDAIKKAAVGVENADDVVMWIRANHADIAKVVKEDGSIDDAVITAAIAAVRSARPKWFTVRTPGSPSNSGGRVPGTKLDDDARAANFKRRRRGV
jgi:hypothetical protein